MIEYNYCWRSQWWLVLFVDMMQFGIAMLGRHSSVGASMVTHMTCTQWVCCEARHYIVEYVSRWHYSVAMSDHLDYCLHAVQASELTF